MILGEDVRAELKSNVLAGIFLSRDTDTNKLLLMVKVDETAVINNWIQVAIKTEDPYDGDSAPSYGDTGDEADKQESEKKPTPFLGDIDSAKRNLEMAKKLAASALDRLRSAQQQDVEAKEQVEEAEEYLKQCEEGPKKRSADDGAENAAKKFKPNTDYPINVAGNTSVQSDDSLVDSFDLGVDFNNSTEEDLLESTSANERSSSVNWTSKYDPMVTRRRSGQLDAVQTPRDGKTDEAKESGTPNHRTPRSGPCHVRTTGHSTSITGAPRSTRHPISPRTEQ